MVLEVLNVFCGGGAPVLAADLNVPPLDDDADDADDVVEPVRFPAEVKGGKRGVVLVPLVKVEDCDDADDDPDDDAVFIEGTGTEGKRVSGMCGTGRCGGSVCWARGMRASMGTACPRGDKMADCW